THLPKVSLERFLEVEEVIKIRDTLTFWKRLPGGQTHLHQQNFDGLSSEDVGARLSAWIQQIPNVQAITALNLSNSNLRYLPPEIGQLTNLERLLFYLNQLTELPLEIGHLTNLQMLGLGENHLTELPPEIGRLTNLQWLYLNQIQLTAVPKTLSNIDVRISLSPECQCIKASIVYRFFQLSPEQKNAVYGHIYHLAIEAGGNIEPWDTQYGENHVFDSEERLEAAMRAVIT
ncbi:MAG: hypothetical protein KAR79_04870, partial [Simkaniaceae bacterium]|nr:hypothetical protein [Simkaniaceae bacterium]